MIGAIAPQGHVDFSWWLVAEVGLALVPIVAAILVARWIWKGLKK